ncbi:MAG: phosphotransferase [Candidatus Acidiferrales bacterium]
MNCGDQIERQVYRLILTRRSATEVLLAAHGAGWALPPVEVRAQERLAEQLTAATRERPGIEAYCLFTSGLGDAAENAPGTKYALLESFAQNANAPKGMYWAPVAVATGEATLPRDDRASVMSALQEMEQYAARPSTGPFARPGWIKELFTWVQEQIGPLGLRVTGGFRQLNASATFSLIRIETTGPAVWFKATGEPNLHERPVTVALARLFPRFVPAFLGVHASWNGWLSWEASGATLDSFGEVSAWERAAKALSELQIASLGKNDELLDSGCKDLRLDWLSRQIDPFLASMSEAMATQKKQPPAILTNSELRILGDELKDACSALYDLALPNTLGHIDFNPGNILVSPEACVFLDWAEACVANPLITFAYLREHSQRQSLEATRSVEGITAAYLQPWQSFISPSDLMSGMALSSLVAVFAYAVSGSAWRSSEALRDPALAGYLRSLTRRMHRDAAGIRERSEPCLH